MKTPQVFVIAVAILTLQFNSAQAQHFNIKTYKLTVSGTSSLHDWESNVEKVDTKGSYVLNNTALADLRDVTVKIPVKSIKSTKGKMMDNKTWEAFDHEKNTHIIFAVKGKKINSTANTVDLNGTLTMAGVTRNIELSVVYKVLPGGDLQVTGTKKLQMTDYKMEPPTAMMGTIKVGDEIAVTFEFVLTHGNPL